MRRKRKRNSEELESPITWNAFPFPAIAWSRIQLFFWWTFGATSIFPERLHCQVTWPEAPRVVTKVGHRHWDSLVKDFCSEPLNQISIEAMLCPPGKMMDEGGDLDMIVGWIRLLWVEHHSLHIPPLVAFEWPQLLLGPWLPTNDSVPSIDLHLVLCQVLELLDCLPSQIQVSSHLGQRCHVHSSSIARSRFNLLHVQSWKKKMKKWKNWKFKGLFNEDS